MSRWLKSVNNLLEKLDGQVENVADGDYMIDDVVGNLLEKAAAGPTRNRENSTEEFFSTDDEEEEYEDEEILEEGEETVEEEIVTEDEYYEEEVTSSLGDDDDEVLSSVEGAGLPTGGGNNNAANQDESEEEDTISIGIPSRKKRLNSAGNLVDDDAVSEISFTDSYIQEVVEEEVPNSEVGENSDVPPKTPSRQVSSERKQMAEDSTTPGTERKNGDASAQGSKQSQNGLARSDSVDCSPRPPRRSLEDLHAMIPAAATDVWAKNESNGEGDPPTDATSSPPKLPTRQASHTAAAPSTEPLRLKASITQRQQKDNKEVLVTTASKQSNPPIKKSENSNETRILTAKIQNLQSQLKKVKNDLKTSQSETKQSEKNVKTLATKLETAEAEINAQKDELLRAGERMEKDRVRAKEEREDLLDEHDEEIEQLKELHEAEVKEQKSHFEKQLEELRQQLQLEESRRMQEGGDWTKELEDAIQREKDALVRLNQMESEKNALQSTASKLEMQHTSLQAKLDSALSATRTAVERERQAEDKLDAALSVHARQISQRQAREAELERTIFELGSALTAARNKEGKTSHEIQSTKAHEEETSFKDLYEQTQEELDSFKVLFNTEKQRREALQRELNEISNERAEETSTIQARQLQYDKKVASLESTISRLQSSVLEINDTCSSDATQSDHKVTQLTQQLDQSREEISKLSEQLLRQQDRWEASKSEILALKGRLDAATSRAKDAEKAMYAQAASQSTSTGRIYEMEGGQIGYSYPGMRRRVKGGQRLRGGSSSIRSIRSALQITSGRSSPAMDQLATTLDGLDSWMVETGAFLRHEPLARLAFLLYLLTLHIWTFALVVFHTTEQPHADFGSLGNNPRNWRPRP